MTNERINSEVRMTNQTADASALRNLLAGALSYSVGSFEEEARRIAHEI